MHHVLRQVVHVNSRAGAGGPEAGHLNRGAGDEEISVEENTSHEHTNIFKSLTPSLL